MYHIASLSSHQLKIFYFNIILGLMYEMDNLKQNSLKFVKKSLKSYLN